MKFRLLAFVLTIGLGLVLTSAVIASGANNSYLTTDVQVAKSVSWGSTDLDYAQQITFTPVATVYLPLTLKDYSLPLYSDDFSDPASGWPVVDTGSISQGYLDGEYSMTVIYGQDTRLIAAPGFEASDYIVTVDVRNPSTMDNGMHGVVFGLSADQSQYYTFEINNFGFYYLSRYDSGTSTDLDSGMLDYLQQYTNTIKIERNGSQIKAYVSDHLVTSVSDATYTGSRQVGVTILSGSDASGAYFDNFAVYAIP